MTAISHKSALATRALIMPITRAIAESRISRESVVKSPNLSSPGWGCGPEEAASRIFSSFAEIMPYYVSECDIITTGQNCMRVAGSVTKQEYEALAEFR